MGQHGATWPQGLFLNSYFDITGHKVYLGLCFAISMLQVFFHPSWFCLRPSIPSPISKLHLTLLLSSESLTKLSYCDCCSLVLTMRRDPSLPQYWGLFPGSVGGDKGGSLNSRVFSEEEQLGHGSALLTKRSGWLVLDEVTRRPKKQLTAGQKQGWSSDRTFGLEELWELCTAHS